MLPSTSNTLFPQDDLIISNFGYPRRLLLHASIYHLKPTSPSPSPSPNYNFHASFKANLIMIMSVLLSALICSLCVNSIIRCMLKCSSYIIRSETNDIKPIEKGLDKKVLRTFPIVKYSKEMNNNNNNNNNNTQGFCILVSECVICLQEFIEGEKLRILPKCNHGFHIKCIDKWLISHTSCPTCRQSLLVDTCQKIIGFNDEHQAMSSSPTSVSRDLVIATTIASLTREDMVRNSRC